MATNNQLQISKDLPNKKITIIRHFDAAPEQVWRAWTESDLLDQWWAPKPWRAETKTMDFREGGYWHYAMVGPDDTKHWSKVDFIKINPGSSFEALDFFCDENGNPSPDFQKSNWKNEFKASNGGTDVVVEITFATEADMQQLMAMGFEGGFTMGLNNLEELLEQTLIK
ncbi:SRPBCC domain-containing protein [Ilyomonas limi]|uniref:SRPBCC domain-containing protein n=1 Tax=Ilyomonas limi TaxID=2575867 RepID=A0A4U3L6Y1_9BACT|nr:SRPBCC domain-containing protein [Ilyomonas limi]TKK69377.1 SRPBCC domain-containing protein [Ilyomonas limi]